MTLEVLVIAAVRILGSLPVLRWAFAGALAAILIDLSDLFLMNLLDLGGVPRYQATDKWLDQVYLALFLLAALRWDDPVARCIAVALYLARLAGFAAFEVTGDRWLLVAVPNLFEFWFVFVTGREWWWRRRGGVAPPLRGRPLVIALVALAMAKIAHEYAIHGARLLDGFTAVEAVRAIWELVTPG